MTDYILTRVTVDDVMSWMKWDRGTSKPCDRYSYADINRLWGGHESLTPLEISKLNIPVSDRLWALLRSELIPEDWMHELACHIAEQRLLNERKLGREPDPRSWAAIEVKRRWIRGKATNEELDTARGAIRGLAWATVWAASDTAAWAAARGASWTITRDRAAILEMVRVMLQALEE
jgi:hypothetical protein